MILIRLIKLSLVLTMISGTPREILQGGTRLIWGPGDKLRLLSKLKILVEITKKIKTNNMTKAMGTFGFGDVQPRTDVPTEPPLIGPGHTAFYWGPSCQ